MPLFVKIDFREDGRLGAWWSRSSMDNYKVWSDLNTSVGETRLRDVFIALADEIDPIQEDEKKGE